MTPKYGVIFLVRPAWAHSSRCKSDTGAGSANR